MMRLSFAVCCLVRGYLPTSKKERSGFEDMAGDQEALSKLNQIKQSLLQELKNYDSSEQVIGIHTYVHYT